MSDSGERNLTGFDKSDFGNKVATVHICIVGFAASFLWSCLSSLKGQAAARPLMAPACYPAPTPTRSSRMPWALFWP